MPNWELALGLVESTRDVACELPMVWCKKESCVTQQTIKRKVSCVGVGLHTGKHVQMLLRPAPPGFGIRFSRTDLPGCPVVAARFDQVVQTDFATTLGLNGVTISTAEHLLAAFLGSGIDNAMVELDAQEVPIFDGSAAPYLGLIREAGIEQQHLPRHFLKVSRPLEVRDGEAFIKVWPSEQLQITYTIDYPHPMLGRQTSRWRFNRNSFEAEIAGARTFGFLKDLDQLQAKGLARGGSLANAMVFDDDRLLNHDGFRFGDECVRHKILDFMGDLALVGRPVLANFEAYKAGHTLHNRLVRQLLAAPDRYQILPSAPVSPAMFNIPEAIAAIHLTSLGI
jgi:UDP-3-O-[3-hydroxymyristoyl] N-acetylglucosamine deacetylase